MSAAHTPGPWTWADVPGAGIQIRGPYASSTRLLFSDIWRAFPEPKWDAEMLANAQLATSAPDLLEFAYEVRRTGDTRLASMAIAVIARAEGGAA